VSLGSVSPAPGTSTGMSLIVWDGPIRGGSGVTSAAGPFRIGVVRGGRGCRVAGGNFTPRPSQIRT